MRPKAKRSRGTTVRKSNVSMLPIPYNKADGSSTGVQENLIKIQGKRQMATGVKTSLQEIAVEILSKSEG